MSARELRSLTGGKTVVSTRMQLRSGRTINTEPGADPDTVTMSDEEAEHGHEGLKGQIAEL